MRKFNFKLQRLLSFRKIQTGEAKTRLARDVGELAKARNESSALRSIRELTVQIRMESYESGVFRPEAMNIHEHLLRIDESIGRSEDQVLSAAKKVDKSTRELLEKRKNERVIENLRKRRFDKWMKDYRREEGKILDDIGTIKFLRDRNKEK